MTKATISTYPERRKGALTGWWYVEINHNDTRLRPRYETKAEAEGCASYYRVHQKLPDGGPAKSSDEPTFGEVAQEALRNRPKWKQGRDRMVGQRLEMAVEKLGHLPISKVTLGELEKYVGSLEKRRAKASSKEKLTGATINRYLAIVGSVLTYAHERGYIGKRPKLPKQKDSDLRIYWYTEDQEDAVCRVLTGRGYPQYAFLVRVLVATGMRVSELLCLEPSQIEDRWIRLWQTKTNKPRSIPIVEGMAKELRALVGAGGLPKYMQIYDQVKLAVKTCGYPRELNVHALRHTTATRLIQRGVPIEVVQKFLGHSNIQTTMRYAHVQDQALENASHALTHGSGYQLEQVGNMQGSAEVVTLPLLVKETSAA
jgi:integrase